MSNCHFFFFFFFVWQTNIFSTQEGMLRWAHCFLGREEKIWPSFIPASDTPCAVVPGQGWVLHLSPLRKLLPALLFPHALLWAAPLPGEPKGGRWTWVWNSSTAFSWLHMAQPWLALGGSSQRDTALMAHMRLECALEHSMGLSVWRLTHDAVWSLPDEPVATSRKDLKKFWRFSPLF